MQADMDIYYSPHGNMPYTMLPLKMANGPLCEKINNEYRTYLITEDAHSIDFPEVGDDDVYCGLLEQRAYIVTNLELPRKLPKFLNQGQYKCVLRIRDRAGTVTTGVSTIIQLS